MAARALWAIRAFGPTIVALGAAAYVAFRPIDAFDRVTTWALLECIFLALLVLIELCLTSMTGKPDSFLWREMRADWGLDRGVRSGFFWATMALAWLMSAMIAFVERSPDVLMVVLAVNAACAVAGWYIRRRLGVLSPAPYAVAFVVGMFLIAWIVGRYAS